MMKKVLKLTSLLLALFMLLTMVACGSGSTNTQSTSTAASVSAASGSSASDQSAASTALPKDPITLKGAIFLESIEANSIKTDPVSKYIQEKFGITLDIVNDCAGSNWDQQAPALVAANDMPDIFMVINQGATGFAGFLNTLVKADVVLPLDDYLPKYAPNLTSDVNLKSAIDYQKEFLSPDGKVYAFPMCIGLTDSPKNPTVTNAIRWDAYKKAGYPAITSYDTLADALKKMQDVAPAGKDGKKAYGVGGWFAEGQGWGDWEITYGTAQYCLVATSIYQQLAGKDTIEPTNGLTDPNSPYWKIIKFYNKANRLGILDPDAFTTKWDDWNKKVEDGTILYCSAGWIPGQKNPTIQQNISPDAGFVSLPPLDEYGQNFIAKTWNIGGGNLYSIAKTCKYPERAVQFLDWVCSQEGSLVMNNGPEGLAWKMVNGKPQGNPDYLAMAQYDTNGYKQYGANLYHHFKGYADATILPKYGTTANLRLSDEAINAQLTSYEKDALAHFGATTFGDANYFGKVKKNIYAYPLRDACGALPEDLLQSNNNIQNYLFKTEFKAILAKTDAEFNKIQQDIIKYVNENRGDEILKYYLDKQTEIKAKLDPICKPLIENLYK